VTSNIVVMVNVFFGHFLGFFNGFWPQQVQPFPFIRSKESFNHYIVSSPAFAIHTYPDRFVGLNKVYIRIGRKLAALVTIYYFGLAVIIYGFFKCSNNEISLQGITY